MFICLFPVQAIRKCLRAINESRAQKRKVMHKFAHNYFEALIHLFEALIVQFVSFYWQRYLKNQNLIMETWCVFILPWQAGQVYGVPLADSLLTKPGVFPEQRPCGEDFRKKWIEVFVSFPEQALMVYFKSNLPGYCSLKNFVY